MRIIAKLLTIGFLALVIAIILFAANIYYTSIDNAADKLGAPRLVPPSLLAFAGLVPAIIFAIGVIAIFMHSKTR